MYLSKIISTNLFIDYASIIQTPKGRSDLAAQIGQHHFVTDLLKILLLKNFSCKNVK